MVKAEYQADQIDIAVTNCPQDRVQGYIDDIQSAADTSIAHLTCIQSLALNVGQYSTAGLKPQNEDAIAINIPQGMALTTKGIVSVISDGVSTAEGGAQASRISVSNFIADYYSTPDTWGVQVASTKVLTALNRWLYGLGQDYRDARKGFVCTFSALIFKSCSVHLLHVGDSRVYRFRDGVLTRLSQDHCTQVAQGKAYLTRALGLDVKLDVDYRQVDVQLHDVYVLLTDGIHDVLTDNEISQALQRMMQQASINDCLCEQVCQQLVEKALVCGSDDNLSAQILSVSSLPEQGVDDVYKHLSKRPFPPPLTVGMFMDDYQVTAILYQSQRSQVYKVIDNTGNSYCMKTPSVNYLDDAAYIERFILESWIGKRIQNPHVVSICHVNKPKSSLYYLTEYLSGQTLAQWINDNPCVSIAQVLGLIKQIERGVRAFHRKETLHQDLKPDNIFLTTNGLVKIIDFGSCYIKGIAEISTPLVRDHILGTIDYSAPEIILGYQAGRRADIFSLAVITYEMLTGQLPFGAKLAKCQSRRDYLALKYIPAHQLNPMLPEWIDVVLKKALSIEPCHRYADTAEFLHALTTVNYPVVEKTFIPLMQRNPLRFWQGLSLLLVICLVCIALK
ncbi:bifunctional protein-serine/threonine kinase/phosphatase [Shewanella intestini]|uniref:non-specific serine/threonine protein kinase n=2 Tax=Shewanellaceae TaxID=267890 RepID=A0ABS5HZG8_9GAMM|nr:bifunctional protein-serine/threonine kinase/phosphatase [Shewanella intestini]MRG35989.1 protein kinase [Shewanella sp. XMDDZSB0408]